PGADALCGVPSAGLADHQQLRGVGGEAIQPTGEGHRKVLVGGRSRSDPATTCRPPERRRAARTILANPATSANGATRLPPGGVITNRVVHPCPSRFRRETQCQFPYPPRELAKGRH